MRRLARETREVNPENGGPENGGWHDFTSPKRLATESNNSASKTDGNQRISTGHIC
jgi:hypothetical protein